MTREYVVHESVIMQFHTLQVRSACIICQCVCFIMACNQQRARAPCVSQLAAYRYRAPPSMWHLVWLHSLFRPQVSPKNGGFRP
jgi:hypothetical protein